MIKCLSIVGFVAVLLHLARGPLCSQEAAGHDIQSLRKLDEAIRNSEALLEKYPDNDFTATLMFQLSELYLKRATLKFQREMLLYEEAEEKYNQGLTTRAPTIPHIDFSETIEISQRLLARYPDIPFRDKILYRVALCYSEEGKAARAAEYYKLLSEETEEKQLLEEAYFRLGEFYFDQKNYTTAIDYYSLLIDSWDSPFFDMALYKLGWAYYNVEDYSKAISTFVFLIEDVSLLEEAAHERIGKSRADLRREAIEYVAICFAEFGGPSKARDFLEEKKDKDYARQVLANLARIYRERNFYEDAIATLNVLLDFYPDRPEAAFYQRDIVQNYELAGDKTQADLERAVMVELYGPGSAWLARIPEGETRDEILQTVEAFLYTLGTEAQARAQSSKTQQDYNDAIAWYENYIEKFPSFERAHKVQFYLAECLYEIAEFERAAAAYYDLLVNYPDSEFGETAAYNRILAYHKLMAAESDSAASNADFFLFNFLGEDKQGVEVLKARSGRQAQLIQACNDFYVYFPRSPRVNEVLMNLAQLLFDLEKYALAKRVYAKVMLEPAGNPYLAKAYHLTAQCDFKEGKYESAESWWQQLRELFPDSTHFVKTANTMISSAKFKRAEDQLVAGDTLQAAQAFVQVAETVPDTAVAERALFAAAEQFEHLGMFDQAIAALEKMHAQFPNSKLADEALFKAGLLCEKEQAWERAAGNYLKLYRHDRFSNFAARSLFAAARCYETARSLDLARQYYGEYVKTYLEDPDLFLEAAFRKAEIAYNQGHYQQALTDLKFVIRSHANYLKQKVAADNYFAANAQFLVAEISFSAYQEVKLSAPLERTLKQKQRLFKNVVKEYTRAAKYKVAEWATASSYKIGRTFEEFADALLASPRPANLTGPDLDKYNQKLWERVLPFKQKARQAYETNLKKAKENGIHNQWIIESEKRLNELSVELGLSTTGMNQEAGL